MAFNILVLDSSQWKWWFAGQAPSTKTRQTVKQWCIAEKADLCFNLGVFDISTGESYTYVAGPKVLTDPDGLKYANIGGASNVLVLDSVNKCKGYSNGIVNNKVSINKGMGGSRTRNGIGITDKGLLIVAQTGHKCTEKQFCEEVLKVVGKKGEKVKLFVLQDGGGSTSEYSAMSKLNFAPEGGRAVATVLCLKHLTLPPMTRPIYKGCTGPDVGILQTVVGGIEVDNTAGPGSKTRIAQAQAALGMAPELRLGVASALTYKKLGLNYQF